MGFSWTPITQYVTLKAAAIANEVKTNIDVVYSDLELSPRSWQYLPVSVETLVQYEEHNEMRVAIDYADDMNYCRNHDVTYNEADDPIARGTVYTVENTGYDSGYKIGVDSNYDSGVDGNYQSTVYTTQKSGYDVTHCPGADNDHKSTVLSTEKDGYDADYDSVVYTGNDISYNDVVDADVDGDYDSFADGEYDTLYRITDESGYQSGYDVPN